MKIKNKKSERIVLKESMGYFSSLKGRQIRMIIANFYRSLFSVIIALEAYKIYGRKMSKSIIFFLQ